MSRDATLPPGAKGDPLHLKVEDADDVRVLSALLQDAATRAGDFHWLPGQRRFAFAASRFRWEDRDAAKAEGRAFERTRVAVRLENVTGIKARGLDPARPDQPLNMLMIAHTPGEGSDTVDILFSGGAAFALEIEALEIYADDIAQPWRTRHQPDHGGE